MIHFNWLQLLPQVGHHYIHVATMLVAVVALIAISFIGRLALGNGEKSITPSDKLSIKGFFEVYIEFIAGLTETVCGEAGKKFVPMFATIFFFILFNNLLGLLPGMTPATDNLNTTIALGIFIFVAYNFYGIKEHGVAYLKHFLGPYLPIAALMVIIELVSHAVRPLSLGLRLQGNMQGDHTVLGIFLDLTPFVVPVIFYCLGIFVCFLQAFVFTLLSMIYVSMAIAHDH